MADPNDPITVPGEETDDPQVVAANLLAAQNGADLANTLTGTGTDSAALAPSDAAPQAPQSQGAKAGYSVKTSGFGPDRGQGAMWQRGMGEFAQEDQRLQGMRDDEMGRTSLAYNDAQQAELDHGAIQAALFKEQGRLLEHQASFERDMANADRVMYAESKAETAQYLDAYKQQLAAVRQMTVVDPRSTLNKWQAGGLSMAMFAQGFLAARGIQIDVGGQVDRWVQQSLHEQETNIQLAREGANDQLNLYNIARQTSQDDLEALHRYRGMVIEGMKTGIDAAAAKFNAPLAQSAAQVAKAKLDIEQTNSLNAIGRQYEEARLKNKKEMRDEIHAQVMERLQSQQVAADVAYKRAQANALNAKQGPEPAVRIADPGATVRGQDGKVTGLKYGWKQNTAYNKELRNKDAETASKAGVEYGAIKKSVDILRQLRAPAMDDYTERFGSTLGAARFSEDYRLYQNQKKLAIMDARHAIAGANLTDNEKKEWDGILEDDSAFERGSNQAKLDQFEKHFRDKFTSTMDNLPTFEKDTDAGDVRDVTDNANDTDANYNARFKGGVAQTNFVAGEEGKATQGSDDSVGDYKGNTNAWMKFSGRYPQSGLSSSGEAEYGKHLESIALAAIQPELVTKQHKVDEPLDKVQADAVDSLQRIAQDGSIPKLRREYAAYLSERLQKEPDALLSDLTSAYGDGVKFGM